MAERQRIPLHHAKGKREPDVDLSNVSGREKSEATREARANTERERTVELKSIGHCHVERSETSLVYFRETKEAEVHPRFFASLRMTIVCRLSLRLSEQLPRFRKRLANFACVSASALRALGSSPALSAYNWRDLLNQFVRLELRSQ